MRTGSVFARIGGRPPLCLARRGGAPVRTSTPTPAVVATREAELSAFRGGNDLCGDEMHATLSTG